MFSILTPKEKTWASQDFAMASTLKEYGFTSVYRVCEQRLLVSFDGGPYAYEIPWLCFLYLKPGEMMTIDEIMKHYEVSCR